MNGHATAPGTRDHRLWVKLLVGFLVLAALLALLLIFFPWDLLRGPLNRYVSEKTGRHFEITRKLDVKLGRTTRILADGIEMANPEWAQDPLLVKAESAEIDVLLLPLLRRRIELPLIQLRTPQLGLQIEGDGRRSWALGRDTADTRKVPQIGQLVVDQGTAHILAPTHGADVTVDFAIRGPVARPASPTAPAGGAAPATDSAAMPLSFTAKGTWEKEPFTAQGRTGNVLYLQALRRPFPMEINATAGGTNLRASGAVASLATLEGADASFNLQGKDLADLYKFVGIVLPSTPRYSVRGRLSKQGDTWHVAQIDGQLGNSDLKGELSFDRSRQVPVLTGQLRSASLDFDDLAPLVGLPEQPRSAAALPQLGGARPAPVPVAAAPNDPNRKLLPKATIDLDRLKRMNADVTYEAARISHVKQLPLDRLSTHVRLNDGVLHLDPLKVGLAAGTVAGRVSIDGNRDPALAEVHLDARSLEFNKLLPGVKITRASFGRINGGVDLKGRGNSVAQMLGSSSGSVAFLMGSGQISNLLMDLAALDGAGILGYLIAGDRNEELRCAAAAFDVKDGVMSSRALVLDTNDTVIYGDGKVSLANEAMDLTLRPYPKDMSLLSLRSPLKLAGSFAKPKAGPDKAVLAGRAGATLALTAVNPLLALAATVETGGGQDANCGPALREAASPHAAARIAVMSRPPDEKKNGKASLGGPPAPAGNGKTQPDAATERDAAAPRDKEARQHAPIPPDQPYGN